ncbi:MAG TPA: dipeptide epimerase, partial [Xanthomonadales bacterium]|nr:dipeptide epimerase [Xanthomonadales bacterium]
MSNTRKLQVSVAPWELKQAFKITGHVFVAPDLVQVAITENGFTGHGEGAGVYYLAESGTSMLAQIESVRQDIEQGADRHTLRQLLPHGGARNALDCALWDLEAKQSGKSIWELTGITPGTTATAYTVGINTPAEMARQAQLLETNLIKVKLDSEIPLERITAVCAARPD